MLHEQVCSKKGSVMLSLPNDFRHIGLVEDFIGPKGQKRRDGMSMPNKCK
jgi:hypothetical protein